VNLDIQFFANLELSQIHKRSIEHDAVRDANSGNGLNHA
jgi:hypothetical protein